MMMTTTSYDVISAVGTTPTVKRTRLHPAVPTVPPPVPVRRHPRLYLTAVLSEAWAKLRTELQIVAWQKSDACMDM